MWRPFPLLLAAAGLSAALFWPQIDAQIPDLRNRPEYQLSWSQVAVTPPHRWVPSHLAAQVRQLSGLPDPLPVLDEGLARQLAAAFARHAWVEDVLSVEKAGPQQVRVELTYRVPVLMVQVKRGLYPVDRNGVLLPPSDFTPSDTDRFPVAEGVRSIPAGPAGTEWGDPAVLGAARLAGSLVGGSVRDSAWEKYGMTVIVILAPDRPAESLEQVTLGVTTKAGSQIVWGRPPGADALEPTVDQKLQRLEKYLPEYGHAGADPSPKRLDVFRWNVVNQQEISLDPHADDHWK